MITSVEQLDAILGVMPAAVGLKVIDVLDDGALRWLAASPLVFVAISHASGVRVTIAGGDPGIVRAVDSARLTLPLAALDDATPPSVGCGIGTLFLVPGLGETLRINGRVTNVSASAVELAIDELYMHCAKSLIRSGFWSAARRTEVTLEPEGFVSETRFVALATANAEGHADLSPKGDPAGNMLRQSGDELSYAERPGNRRKDGLRNLLTQPRAALIALIPGSSVVGLASGEARLVHDAASCGAFTFEGKTPLLVTKIGGARLALQESAALARVMPWPLRATDHGLDPAAIFAEHVKLNKTGGLGAGLMRKLVSKELMTLGLKHDYKNKLY